jgi:hypothetical protein
MRLGIIVIIVLKDNSSKHEIYQCYKLDETNDKCKEQHFCKSMWTMVTILNIMGEVYAVWCQTGTNRHGTWYRKLPTIAHGTRLSFGFDENISASESVAMLETFRL